MADLELATAESNLPGIVPVPFLNNLVERLQEDIQGEDEVNFQPAADVVDFDKEMFLEEVRKYRCLWDINSESYKIRPTKQNAWTRIGAVFNKDGEFNFILNIDK